MARDLAEPILTLTVLVSIAAARHRAGELEVAERCYREALGLARAHAGRVAIVIALNSLIRLLVARGCLDQARVFAAECLSLARDEKVRVDLLEATVGLASKLGDHVTAARFWGASDRQLLAWGYRHEPGEDRAPCAVAGPIASCARRRRLRRRRGGGARDGLRSGHARAGAPGSAARHESRSRSASASARCNALSRRLAFVEAFEKGDQVVDLGVGQSQRPQDPLAVGVQPVLVEVRVVPHDVAQRGQAAVVHVGRGARHVAQRGHLELAVVAVLERDVPRADGASARGIVVERARAGCSGSPSACVMPS